MDIRRHAHTHIDHKYAHTPTGRQRQTQTHAVFASRISDFVTWRLLAVLISCFTVEYCYKGPLSRDSLNFELKERRLRRSCWPRSHFSSSPRVSAQGLIGLIIGLIGLII